MKKKKTCEAAPKGCPFCRAMGVVFLLVGAVVTAAAVLYGAKKLWGFVAPKLPKRKKNAEGAEGACACNECGKTCEGGKPDENGEAEAPATSGDAVPDEGPIDGANDIFPNA